MPTGTIVSLTRNQQPTATVGCMNNLYERVENLEVYISRTEVFKTMLLYPRNGAQDQCKKLRLKIDDSKPLDYFTCGRAGFVTSDFKIRSHYKTAICNCGMLMKYFDIFERERVYGDGS
ncbi:hypothetical protein CRYUN_Cryun25bG0098000 [Craigia yunnanensis]